MMEIRERLEEIRRLAGAYLTDDAIDVLAEIHEDATKALALLGESEPVTDAKATYMNLRTCICGADASDHTALSCGGFDPDWGRVRKWIKSLTSPTPTPEPEGGEG